MDFASAPFQKLLFENADDDQLLSFLEQLDLEYSSAIDEKTRFGTLQILLPTLKAHVLRLESDQEACLETFVKPWMLSSFSQDSMVSTESVMALEGAVAFLIKRFFDGFGKTCIMDMFLPQLLLAVKLEPDFVDLDPIAFIEKSVDVTALMEKVDKMMGSLDQVVMLDLECCISCLNRFVMELNNQDDGKVLTIDEAHQKEEEENEMYPIMELIFTIAVALIPCTDTTIRTKLTHDLLPNLLRWQQSSINHVSHEKQVKWCEVNYGIQAKKKEEVYSNADCSRWFGIALYKCLLYLQQTC
jgi:hypothetical protein